MKTIPEIFGSMVSALGGPIDFVTRADSYLAKAPVVKPVYAPEAGTIAAVDDDKNPFMWHLGTPRAAYARPCKRAAASALATIL